MTDQTSSTQAPSPSAPDASHHVEMLPDNMAWPEANEVWREFGDENSTACLATTKELAEYKNAVRHFHACLALVVRGLHVDEVMMIFCSSLPAFYNEAAKTDRVKIQDALEAAHEWVETHLLAKVEWFKTPAGTSYLVDFQRVKGVHVLSLNEAVKLKIRCSLSPIRCS